MTDNLPAVRQEAGVARSATDIDSWVDVVQPIGHLAERINDTAFVPTGLRGSAPAVAAAILYGREIGWGPMTSLAGVYVVEGKPTVSAELLRAMVLAAGHEITYPELSGSRVVARGRRAGTEEWTSVEWTLDSARAAGLLGKSVWQKYPRAMLTARATAELCRLIFPDVTHGLRATEEMETETPDGEPARGGSAAESRTTVRRKGSASRRTKGDDGAAPRDPAGTPAVEAATAAPSSPPMPPLPGEPGATANELGGTSSEPHPGSADGARRDDPGSGPDLPAGNGEESAGADGPADTGADRVEPTGERPQDASPSAPADPAPSDEGEKPEAVQDEDRPRMFSRGAQRAMFAAFKGLDITDDAARLYATSAIVGRQVASSNDLTEPEGRALMEVLNRCETREQLLAVIAATEQDQADPA